MKTKLLTTSTNVYNFAVDYYLLIVHNYLQKSNINKMAIN